MYTRIFSVARKLNETTEIGSGTAVKKSVILLILLLIFHVSNYSQNLIPSLEPISILPNSPNAASLGQFVQVPVSSYTGIPEINIPLWNIEKGDITLPISLSYHAGGIKVDQISSWVGLGWSINTGGVITRSVRGLIDGETFSYTKLNKYLNGKMSYFEMAQYRDDVVNGREDSEPDIYYLNMSGVNCQFFQHEDGRFVTLPLDAGIIIHRVYPNVWTITDNRGIKYTFSTAEKTESVYSTGDGHFQSFTAWYISRIEDTKGNSVQFLYSSEEYMFKNKAVEKVNLSKGLFYGYGCPAIEHVGLFTSNTISAPVLRSIAYGSSEIIFDLSPMERFDLPGSRSLKSFEILDNKKPLKKFVFLTSYFNNIPTGTVNNRFHIYEEMDKYRLRLDAVREESHNVILPSYKFSYVMDKGLPYRLSNAQDHWGFFNGADNYDFVSYFQNDIPKGADKKVDPSYSSQFTLSKIIYPTGGQTLYEYEGNTVEAFGQNYSYQTFAELSGDNSTSRTGDDKEKFTKEIELDFKEYNAGNNVSFDVSYTVQTQPNGDCSFEFYLAKKNEEPIRLVPGKRYSVPPEKYTLRGIILQPIVGSAPFPVSYHLKLSGNVIWNNVKKDNENAPGIRIKKITNLSEGGVPLITQYDYSDPSSGKSSGSLSSEASYKVELEKQYPHYTLSSPPEWEWKITVCSYTQFSSHSNYPLVNEKAGYVGYKFVTQLYGLNGGNGKIETEYLSFNNYSDLNSTCEFPFAPVSSQSWKRGIPIAESTYNHTGQGFKIKQQKRCKYKIIENSSVFARIIKVGAKTSYLNEMQTITPAQTRNYIAAEYAISSDAFKLVEEEVEEFDGSFSILTKNNYEYDKTHFLLNKVFAVSSDRTQITKEVEYPFDMVKNNLDPAGIYQGMVQRNMLPPIITKKKIGDKYVQYFQNEFMSPQPNKYYLGKYTSWNYLKNNKDIELEYKKFDGHGNPLEVQKRDGIAITYLWGYNNRYLVAEIIGAFYDDVKAIVNVDLISSGSFTPAQLRNELNKLRTDTKTRRALVTTFTYFPLVGIESRTDPNGIATFYEYDDFGRLSLIRDNDNNIIKKICYNYVGQLEDCPGSVTYLNDAQSRSFIRNNCSSGQNGSTVTYTIPKGKYTSTVSLADANTKAQNDINVNGQAYANTNGTCLSPTIYARMELELYIQPGYTTADIYVRFYKDPARTIRASVNNVTVSYESVRRPCKGGVYKSNFTKVANGSEVYLGNRIIDRDDGLHCEYTTFNILPGNGYIPL